MNGRLKLLSFAFIATLHFIDYHNDLILVAVAGHDARPTLSAICTTMPNSLIEDDIDAGVHWRYCRPLLRHYYAYSSQAAAAAIRIRFDGTLIHMPLVIIRASFTSHADILFIAYKSFR